MDAVMEFIREVEGLKNDRKWDEAIEKIQKKLSVYNDDYRLYEELGDIYMYLGDFKKAYKSINYALDLNPDSATGNYLKGFILLSKNKDLKAIEFLEKSNRLIPNNSEVLRNLGWAYSTNKQPFKGLMILRRALNLSPTDEYIMEDLGMALLKLGESEKGNSILAQIKRKKV